MSDYFEFQISLSLSFYIVLLEPVYRFRFGIVIAADVTVYVVASGTGPVLVVADVDSLVMVVGADV